MCSTNGIGKLLTKPLELHEKAKDKVSIGRNSSIGRQLDFAGNINRALVNQESRRGKSGEARKDVPFKNVGTGLQLPRL